MYRLILLAFLSDLLTPTIIWKFGIPSEVRYVSTMLLAVVIAGAYVRIIRARKMPAVVWAVLAFTLLGCAVALLHGQDIPATLWGWWVMFRYPLLGVFVYLDVGQDQRTTDWLRLGSIWLLGFEVVIQILQYLTGERPGDSLAGSLGPNGTSQLLMLIIWALAVALGNWIASGKYFPV